MNNDNISHPAHYSARMGIGQTIKHYRELKGMNKSELARLIDVSPAYITMLEREDKRKPSMDLLLKIGTVLDIPVKELLDQQTDRINFNEITSLFSGKGFECKDVINIFTECVEGVEAYYLGNILKYLWRYKDKNGIEDLKKAKQYIDFLMEECKEVQE